MKKRTETAEAVTACKKGGAAGNVRTAPSPAVFEAIYRKN
jgi:hypothetical protein